MSGGHETGPSHPHRPVVMSRVWVAWQQPWIIDGEGGALACSLLPDTRLLLALLGEGTYW